MRSYREDTVREFEAWLYAQRNAQRTHDNHLADTSCHANTFPSNRPVSSSSVKRLYPPNLTDAKRTLLRDNKHCFKCCRTFEGKCEALTGTNYIPVTQATIDAAKKTRHVRPNTHVATTSITQSEPTLSIPEIHPVTAIMPGITNPVTYHAANNMTVLEGSDSSDDEVSVPTPNSVGAFLESVEAIVDASTLKSQSLKEISPLIVPYLIWRASASPPNSLPVSFDCLLDNGSHLVLICESLVAELGLRRKKLKIPIKTDLAMVV